MAISGRLEKEEKIRKKIQKKLKDLNPILTDFYNDMRGYKKSYNTINSYINYIIEFMNFISIDNTNDEFYKNIKPADIKRYIVSISTREVNGEMVAVSDDLQATKWSAINTFFVFLVNNDCIETNPMIKTKRPKVNTEHKVTYLTQSEINQMFDNIKKMANPKLLNRDLALFSLFLSTGLRNSALTQINIDDINFSNNTIKVVEKGNKTRTIQFGLNMRQLLLSWLKDREIFFEDVKTNALFISQLKERISIHTVGQLVEKYTKNITNKHITPHKLRATACTIMSANGIPVQVIKDMVGHENIQTTTRYVGVLDEERKQASNVLDNSIKSGA